jgi:thiol-disulfide isomerase/thioredoxin
VIVVVAVGAVVVANGSDPASVRGPVDTEHLAVGPPPPSLTAAKGWLNSPPLAPADLQGKVVLYDFWTYSCVNCVRVIPYVRSWYDRYRQDGLVVVGIHSPEFDFEKNRTNVSAAVQHLDVDYPVALDDDLAIWSAFGAQYWPEQWIADRQGHLRYQTIGEGGERGTEDVIRKLLGISTSTPRAAAVDEGNVGRPPTTTEAVTPETYLGLERGTTGAKPGTATYPEVKALPTGAASLVGTWQAESEDVRSAGAGAGIVFRYRAREVNLVMATDAPGGQPVDVEIRLDGKPLPVSDRTSQTMVGTDGHTFVRVASSELYRLVLGSAIETHTLRLTVASPGLQAFAFTFSA